MNGFKFALFFLLMLAMGSCVRQARAAKEGNALYLMYKTSFTQPKMVGFWKSPADLLPEISPSERLFIENLSPDTLIFQINQGAYVRAFTYKNGGKNLELDLVSRLRGNSVSVSGHLIFIRRSEADSISVQVDKNVLLLTNLQPRK